MATGYSHDNWDYTNDCPYEVTHRTAAAWEREKLYREARESYRTHIIEGGMYPGLLVTYADGNEAFDV